MCVEREGLHDFLVFFAICFSTPGGAWNDETIYKMSDPSVMIVGVRFADEQFWREALNLRRL
jgi:hypothetical protein